MKALISTFEPVLQGYRVAQVEPDADIFPVAEALFWTECADDVVADRFWYDPVDSLIKSVPEPAPTAQPVSPVQPTSTGTQTL